MHIKEIFLFPKIYGNHEFGMFYYDATFIVKLTSVLRFSVKKRARTIDTGSGD